MNEKIPPQNLEAEQSVLGAMMISKTAIALVAGKLRQEYFYREAHAHIFKAILSLYQKSEPVDLVTVSAELKKHDTLEAAGGRSYLADVVDSVPTAANVEKYATLVAEKGILRKLIDAGSAIISDAFDDSQEMGPVLDAAQKAILDISKEQVQDDFVPIKSVLNSVFDNIQSVYGNDEKILGVPTGFPDLDQMTSGFQKGDLIILAARPSMGKTTLALNLATHAAVVKKIPVAIFSLEMPKEQLVLRLLCSEAKLDSKRLRTANLLDHEFKDLNQAFGRLGDAPIFIDDSSVLSPLQFRAKTRRLQMEAPDLGLILIDYMQLMSLQRKRIESRFHEVSEIVRDIKAFAKESQIPVVALSQLSRDVEKRQDKTPQLSDLRESGEIEQTADLVMFIHRDDYYDQAQQGKYSHTKLVIAKQRNGPTGTVDMMFQRDISKFRPADKDSSVMAPPL